MSADIPYLEALDGDLKGTQFRLLAEVVTIGRSPDCDVPLPEVRGVSRRHAQVMLVGDRVRVRDLESQNGTLVDGKRVKEAYLAPGSRIKVGEATFAFGIVAAGATGEAAPPARASVRGQAPQALAGAAVAETAEAGLAAGAGAAVGPARQSARREIAEDAVAAAGEQSRNMLITIGAMALIVACMLYLAAFVIPQGPPRYQPGRQRLLAKGETRVIPVDRLFASFRVEQNATAEGGQIVEVEHYQGRLRDEIARVNRENEPRGQPVMDFLVISGQARGEAKVVLLDKANQPLRTIEILVRGANRPPWLEEASDGEARSAVERMLAEARRMEQDGRLHEAIVNYQQAERISLKTLGDQSRAFEIQNSYQRLRVQLKERLEIAFREAMGEAFPPPHAPRPQDYRSAFLKLVQAKSLVPDPQNEEWQIMDCWQARIRELVR